MKHLLVLFAVLLVLSACNSKPKEYTNTKTEQIISQLKWGLDYSSVKNILTEKYKLDYSREIEQSDKNKLVKVYEFMGGKYNDIETESWVVAFKNDSLQSIMIKIFKEQPNENEKLYKNLCDLNNQELIKENSNVPNENRWFFEKDGEKLSEILISTWPENKGIAILFSRTM
jgi:hypothetical protein